MEPAAIQLSTRTSSIQVVAERSFVIRPTGGLSWGLRAALETNTHVNFLPVIGRRGRGGRGEAEGRPRGGRGEADGWPRGGGGGEEKHRDQVEWYLFPPSPTQPSSSSTSYLLSGGSFWAPIPGSLDWSQWKASWIRQFQVKGRLFTYQVVVSVLHVTVQLLGLSFVVRSGWLASIRRIPLRFPLLTDSFHHLDASIRQHWRFAGWWLRNSAIQSIEFHPNWIRSER